MTDLSATVRVSLNILNLQLLGEGYHNQRLFSVDGIAE